ncbi:hypothetical protein ID866_12021, partial [Astraeus odoratus]
MDDWTEFVIELQSTFSPHNPVTNTKNQLDHLQMKKNQHINEYVVKFNQLMSQVRGYGDEICHIGKPHNLDNMCYLAQEIDACYWECKEEVQHANKSSSKGKPTTSSNTSSSSGNTNSLLSNKPKSSNGGNKSSNVTSSNSDLTGKLGKDGKLTPEERKQHLDNKLWMFCRDDGHFSNNCLRKANKGKAKACAANATQFPQEQLGSTSGSAPKPKLSYAKISLLSYEIPDLLALVDSGSTHCFMDQSFINNYAISAYSIAPIQLQLINGTSNFIITQAADLSVWFPMTGDVTPMMFYLVPLDSECKVV